MGRAMCIRKEGAEHGRVKAGVANIKWSPEDRERERKWRLGQDQKSVKLDTRQPIVVSCELDGEGYVQ